jgi:hypothetical protein
MDVSEEILQNHLIYGASDYTNPRTLSASKSLNYAKGASIQNPIVEDLTILPFTYHYQDSVGLFGTENRFVRVDVNIDETVSGCVEEQFWECAEITDIGENDPFYTEAVIDFNLDLITVNSYEPARLLPNSIPTDIYDAYASVDLHNLKVGNQYIDNWLDVRLYNRTRQLNPTNHMWVKFRDVFYIGFHARNTRELPYNVKVTIGNEIRSGLPSTECYDDWAVLPPSTCICIEEDGWVCAEMRIFNETYPGWIQAEIDRFEDPTSENTFEPARVFLQGSECLTTAISDLLGLPRQVQQEVPPPKTKAGMEEPCCSTCH